MMWDVAFVKGGDGFMNKLKIGILLVIVFFVGIGVGSIISGGKSSTKSVSSGEKETRQSTTSGNSKSENAGETVAGPTQMEKDRGKVEVKSQTKRIASTGTTDIVGEVINKTQNDAMWIKVTATFYDASGNVIATNDTYAGDTTETPLSVGMTAPFNVSSYPDKINADSFKLDVTWRGV